MSFSEEVTNSFSFISKILQWEFEFWNVIGPQEIYSIYKCLDGLLLCSIKNENGNYSIVKYKYENEDMKKIIEKEKVHESDIYTCIELNDGTIASGGSDKLIKLWRN